MAQGNSSRVTTPTSDAVPQPPKDIEEHDILDHLQQVLGRRVHAQLMTHAGEIAPLEQNLLALQKPACQAAADHILRVRQAESDNALAPHLGSTVMRSTIVIGFRVTTTSRKESIITLFLLYTCSVRRQATTRFEKHGRPP
jgi:hypothetical protein